MSLWMISSHSTFCRHSSCISSLGSNVNGASIPIGLNKDLINANIPLLVSSNTLSIGLIDSRSVSNFHKIPSTFYVCTRFSEIFGDISEYGKVSKNDFSLDSHFVNLKPPFDNTLIIVLAVLDNLSILECELHFNYIFTYYFFTVPCCAFQCPIGYTQGINFSEYLYAHYVIFNRFRFFISP